MLLLLVRFWNLIVQGILGSLRGIWAPMQQPVSGQVGGGSGSGIFYLMIFGLLAVLFLWVLNQKGNPEPTKPLQPIQYKNEEPRTSSMQFNEFEPFPESRLEQQSPSQLESTEPEYDFGDYPIKSISEDRYQEELPAPPRYVIQYLAGNDFAAAQDKKLQLQSKFKKFSIYLADQGGALPYKILIGDFASDRDARSFIIMYNLNDSFIKLLSDYQLAEFSFICLSNFAKIHHGYNDGSSFFSLSCILLQEKTSIPHRVNFCGLLLV